MRLIVNGDDFGITHACNIAIIDCFQQGIMTSTSMMTNMPYAKEAAKLWEEHPQLSVGLHLNLTVGFPLGKGLKTICNEEGSFHKRILNIKSEDIDVEEMRRECQMQMDKFIELTNRIPDHINSHHGIERIPGGKDVLQALSIRYDIPIRQLTNMDNSSSVSYSTKYVIPKKRYAQPSTIKIEEITNLFTDEEIKQDGYFEWLGHPGYIDFELLQLSSLTTGRCMDAYCFCSDAIKKWIKDNHIELITYRDLPKIGKK